VRPRIANTIPRNVPRAHNRRLCNSLAVASFFRDEGLNPYSLTPEEAAQASKTPDLTAKSFTDVFGSSPFYERRSPDVGNFVCINRSLQFYGPSSPGLPGLLFLTSNTVPLEAPQETFLMFLLVKAKLKPIRRYRYLGTYTRVPVARTTLGADEWAALPCSVSQSLTSCIYCWG
jgi:hypothetical protein